MRITTLTLDTVTESATGAVEFTFTPARALSHRPGQAGLLMVPGGGAKLFTFSSGADSDQVSIATSLRSGSRFKTALAALRPGSQVTVAGGFGGPRGLAAPVRGGQVFVAQGIGITPFLAVARSHRGSSAGPIDATLLQVGTAHYFAEVAATVRAAEHHAHREQLVDAIGRTAFENPQARWIVSGRGSFVAAVAHQLRSAGVDRSAISKAAFTGMRAARPAAPSALLAA